MPRRKKVGNYTIDDRRLIMMAATSLVAGISIPEKQQWLMSQGVHRPGVPEDPVSVSAIKYWKQVDRKFRPMCDDEHQYQQLLEYLFNSPKSYRILKNLQLQEVITI